MLTNTNLTPKQEKAIDELLAGKSQQEAAFACGVTEQTMTRWVKDPAFQQAYQKARQLLLDHSISKLQGKFDKAVDTLARNMDSRYDKNQIKAAEVIVATTLQTARLMERIAELEAQVAEQEQDMMYKVVFDLRMLTREEREVLEAIHNRINGQDSALPGEK